MRVLRARSGDGLHDGSGCASDGRDANQGELILNQEKLRVDIGLSGGKLRVDIRLRSEGHELRLRREGREVGLHREARGLKCRDEGRSSSSRCSHFRVAPRAAIPRRAPYAAKRRAAKCVGGCPREGEKVGSLQRRSATSDTLRVLDDVRYGHTAVLEGGGRYDGLKMSSGGGDQEASQGHRRASALHPGGRRDAGQRTRREKTTAGEPGDDGRMARPCSSVVRSPRLTMGA